MIWKTIIFTFCLLQTRTHDQSECTNVSHSKAQFLPWGNLRSTWYFTLVYGDLQTILRFRKNKYTNNSQLQSHVDKHSKNVETIRIAQHPEEMWEGGASIRRKERSNFCLHLFCLFLHNFEEHIIELTKVFSSVFAKETLSMIQFFNASKLLLGDWFLFLMCLSNPLRKVIQNMVNIQTYKHFSQKIISGAAVRCSKE